MCRSCPTACGCGCGFQKRVCVRCGHYVVGNDLNARTSSRTERNLIAGTAVVGTRSGY